MDSNKNKNDLGVIDQVLMAAEKGESFNFDQAKLKLLILCKNKNFIDQSATFLERRGWDVVVTTEMREVFKIITVFKPDMFFVSVNYPNQKISKLPAVVAQTFRTQVVTFGELNDTKTLQLMQTINSNYKMPGAVSGPNIQRRVKQILQEIYSPTSIVAAEESTGQNEKQNEAKQTDTAKKSKGPGIKIFSSDKSKQGPAIIIAKGAAAIPSSEQIGKLAEEFAMAEMPSDVANSENDLSVETKSALALAETEAGSSDGALFSLKQAESTPSSSATGVSFNINEKSRASSVETDELLQAVAEISEKASLNFEAPAANMQAQEQAQAPAAMYEGTLSLERVLKDSAIAASLKRQQDYLPLQTTSEALIVPVEYDGHKGIILLVQSGTAKDRVLFEQKFLSNLKGVRGKQKFYVGKTQRMYFEEVEVRQPTDVGVISLKLPNASGEACLTYVENEAVQLRTKRLSSGKSEVSIQDIAEGCVVGADVFLHLPQNNKYYKVVSGSGWISKKQKERLVAANAAIFIDTANEAEFKEAQSKAKAVSAAKAQWRPLKKAG